jgi:hypothetical protein
MLPVPPGIPLTSDRPRDAHTGVQGPLAADLRRFLDPLCALKPSDVRRGGARALRPVADGSWAIQVQGRSSNRPLATELQTYKVTKYGVRIYVTGRVPVGRVSQEMTPGADLYRIGTYNTHKVQRHRMSREKEKRNTRTRARDRGTPHKVKPPSIMLIPIPS